MKFSFLTPPPFLLALMSKKGVGFKISEFNLKVKQGLKITWLV